jgi:hypothetical protein
MREEWERFGHSGVALRIDDQMRGVDILLYLGGKRDPSWTMSQGSPNLNLEVRSSANLKTKFRFG